MSEQGEENQLTIAINQLDKQDWVRAARACQHFGKMKSIISREEYAALADKLKTIATLIER